MPVIIKHLLACNGSSINTPNGVEDGISVCIISWETMGCPHEQPWGYVLVHLHIEVQHVLR